MKLEYLVITQLVRPNGKFKEEKLEQLLDEHANEGWRVTSMTTVTSRQLFFGITSKLVILLERPLTQTT